MTAEMKPDIYGGDNFNNIIPQWYLYVEGDKDGMFVDDDGEGRICFNPKGFAPGTRIVIEEPVCPKCGYGRSVCQAEGCDFDWDVWVQNEYC
jgi:hypothetical protein